MCDGFGTVAVLPSPKFHAYITMAIEPPELKFTASGMSPAMELALMTATRAIAGQGVVPDAVVGKGRVIENHRAGEHGHTVERDHGGVGFTSRRRAEDEALRVHNCAGRRHTHGEEVAAGVELFEALLGKAVLLVLIGDDEVRPVPATRGRY